MASGRRRFAAAVLGCASILASVRAAVADPDAARSHYERALHEVRAGELSKARASFEEAYRLSPHYLVLYNLGKVTFELRDYAAARDYFERYLEGGGDAISPVERERVLALIESCRSHESGADAIGGDGSGEVSGATQSSTPALAARPADESAPSSDSTRSPARSPARGATPIELARERQTTLAFALGGMGVVLSAVGTGVLVWNAGRYADYEEARDDLGEPPASEIGTQDELERALEYARATERNRAELEAIEDFDVVGFTLVGVGAGLVATGVVLYLTRPNETVVGLNVGVSRVRLSLSF